MRTSVARVGVRLVNKGSSVGLTFASSPARDDVVLETPGMVVSVPPDVATALEQAVVDAKAENGTTHLVLRRRKTSARPS
jgi:hypothetical protein